MLKVRSKARVATRRCDRIRLKLTKNIAQMVRVYSWNYKVKGSNDCSNFEVDVWASTGEERMDMIINIVKGWLS